MKTESSVPGNTTLHNPSRNTILRLEPRGEGNRALQTPRDGDWAGPRTPGQLLGTGGEGRGATRCPEAVPPLGEQEGVNGSASFVLGIEH